VSLNYDVFVVEPKPIPSQIPGFEEAVGKATWPPSMSTLIWGDDGGGLLVDSLIMTTEAAALAAWVRSHERPLEYIYITHPYADHLLGLPAVLEAYPNAKPVAVPESIGAMEEQVSPRWLQMWGAFFPDQLPDLPVVPAPLPGMSIPIGDRVATVVPVGTTDTDPIRADVEMRFGEALRPEGEAPHGDPRGTAGADRSTEPVHIGLIPFDSASGENQLPDFQWGPRLLKRGRGLWSFYPILSVSVTRPFGGSVRRPM
jgi:hypothetical protein